VPVSHRLRLPWTALAVHSPRTAFSCTKDDVVWSFRVTGNSNPCPLGTPDLAQVTVVRRSNSQIMMSLSRVSAAHDRYPGMSSVCVFACDPRPQDAAALIYCPVVVDAVTGFQLAFRRSKT